MFNFSFILPPGLKQYYLYYNQLMLFLFLFLFLLLQLISVLPQLLLVKLGRNLCLVEELVPIPARTLRPTSHAPLSVWKVVTAPGAWFSIMRYKGTLRRELL